VAGGASTVQQALRAGAIDELILNVAPVILGSGERLLDGVTGVALEALEVAASPHATHVRYRVTPAQ
jgi:dihydrofolate reductase